MTEGRGLLLSVSSDVGFNSRPATDYPHPYLRGFSQVPIANAGVALHVWSQKPVFTYLAASNQFLANSYSPFR